MNKIIVYVLLLLTLISCGGGSQDSKDSELKLIATLNNCDAIYIIKGNNPTVVYLDRCVNDVILSTETLITLQDGETLVLRHNNGASPSMNIFFSPAPAALR